MQWHLPVAICLGEGKGIVPKKPAGPLLQAQLEKEVAFREAQLEAAHAKIAQVRAEVIQSSINWVLQHGYVQEFKKDQNKALGDRA